MHYHLISSIHPPPRPNHPVATNPPSQIHTTHTQQSTNILTPLGLGYDIIHALSSHPSIHLLDQVTLLPPTQQSRSNQQTHNNQLTYLCTLALDMISSMHYHLISSIHQPPRPSHPIVTNPPVQIHTTRKEQSINILPPLGLGYNIIHVLSLHLIHPSIHLLDQVTPLQSSAQSRSTQHTHNNQLTYSHPLALDIISSMHYHTIHPSTSSTKSPHCHQTTVQIHTTHTEQSTNLLTPLGLGYDINHDLLSHLIHRSTSSTKSPHSHQPSSQNPHNTHTTIN